ncbi:MAG TPA: alpha/beta fold hydrolase [Opitutaceae bacterium]|nr:alpha/beta fold hydrolase [Opitutaceae bacterium]
MRSIVICVVAAAFAATGARAMSTEQRHAQLDWMLKNLPDAPEWRAWQQKTGELPPDFDALPKQNALPDPLHFVDGRAVKNEADWRARRAEIRALLEKWAVGSVPPKPQLDHIVPLGETRGPGYVTRTVRLEFGPDDKATAQVTITLPEGAGPFPVLIGTGWTGPLLRRGYISASYNESVDQPSNLPALYPDFDFATMGQRAWTAQLVVDYLFTLPQVDRARIAITGYSRTGKMATIAAALDERIAAVIAGSTGVGGILPWRLAGERGAGEGIESTTRMFPLWFQPRLRFFAGHEDRLPFDGNLLVALVAPRACLMEYGLNDEVSNTWGSEQSYNSAIKVYDLLGRHDALDLLRVPGFHGANDQELCLDWLDQQFGRAPRTWTNPFLFAWNFDAWRARSGEDGKNAPAATPVFDVNSAGEWETKAAAVRAAVNWALGDAPPKLAPNAAGGRGGFIGRGPTATATKPVANPGQLGPDVPGWVITRNSIEFGWNDPDRSAAESRRFRFAGNVTGDLYFPKDTPPGAKLPTVIWLHGFSYPLGYMWVYRRDLHPVLALVKAGYAVLAYDQCGYGSRMNEIGPFYERWPHWSQLGRMVEDARAAIDTLEKDAVVDPERIYLLGYTLGGAVALHTAALDPRVKGVVSICGFTPLRTDTPAHGTIGLARFSHERPLAPRLGFFIGRETEAPYDYDALIATIAPRPVLIVQPQQDRDAVPGDVHAAVEQARKIYSLLGAPAKLGLDEPDDYARFPTATQDRAIEWMRKNFTP